MLANKTTVTITQHSVYIQVAYRQSILATITITIIVKCVHFPEVFHSIAQHTSIIVANQSLLNKCGNILISVVKRARAWGRVKVRQLHGRTIITLDKATIKQVTVMVMVMVHQDIHQDQVTITIHQRYHQQALDTLISPITQVHPLLLNLHHPHYLLLLLLAP